MTGKAPRITALRAHGTKRVAIELDGQPWRVVPLESVLRVGLDVGVVVDRQRARALGRDLRRERAHESALRALARRDHSAASLDARLARDGIGEGDRRRTVSRLRAGGLVDDRRFAQERAHHLARRDAGNHLIWSDLTRQGVADEHISAAIEGLEPESERAARILATRSPAGRTLRRLAARGFSEETLEALIGDLRD